MYTKALQIAVGESNRDVFPILVAATSDMVKGELYQIEYSSVDSINKNHYLRIIELKTARFMAACMKLGAVQGHLDDVSDILYEAGLNLGYAFQIVDDVLDFSGDQDKIGKPVASDLRQGLITLPTIYYLESEPDDPDLSLALNGILYDEMRLTRLIHGIRSSGAIEKSIDEAGQHIARALDALDDLPQSVEHQALEDLANYIIQRHY